MRKEAHRLTMEDRRVIAARWENGERVMDIAEAIGCAYSTVYAELRKGMTGKAYVQIIPSAEGISGKIKEALGDPVRAEGESAGEGFATKMVSAIKKAVAAAGLGKAISAAITEGANLEQSIGGIETLFGDSADTMKQYAAQAYATAGVSANTYMEQATSFAASLVSSLGGDTAAAAETANQAIVDMSDNANKMGTSMEDIQNAYQGFAKQNYTMLDNLKLGYGGTQAEMQRLLEDAQELTGVEYDISNLDDVYNAIHVIQENLGITGTTAEEAASTFSGSFASMKAAAQNQRCLQAHGRSDSQRGVYHTDEREEIHLGSGAGAAGSGGRGGQRCGAGQPV